MLMKCRENWTGFESKNVTYQVPQNKYHCYTVNMPLSISTLASNILGMSELLPEKADWLLGVVRSFLANYEEQATQI